LYVSWEMPGYVLGWHPAVMKYSWTSNALDGSKWMNWFPCGCKQNILIPVEIFVTKSEASGPLQNGFWLPFCAKFWPWVLPSCKWTPPWYRNFALEVRVCYPPVPTILSESGGLINNHYKLDGFKA
jgi:hypothetical protein